MRRSSRIRLVAFALGAGLLLAGCIAGRDLAPEPVNVAALGEAQNAAQLAEFLENLQRLVQGGPAEQAEIVAAAHAGYEQSRKGSAALRYGLALAAPGHPAHDAAGAQRLLRDVLANPERLMPAERSLAIVELQRMDIELRLHSENERLVAELQRERGRDRSAVTSAAAARRLQTEIDENARLKRALDEARAKLDAIANIERSTTDRKPATEGRIP